MPARHVTRSSRIASTTRWLASHQHLVAALLLALLVLAYLWPALIGGHVLSPRGILFSYEPWAAAAPSDWAERTNFILGDVVMSHYPFHLMVRDMLHDGIFPAWSQHAYGGVPFFANPQTLVLSPFALPIWLLPLELGISVSAALKLWVAGFGTYLLVRELRLGFWPAMLAGVSFALCAFSVLWLTHETLLAVAAILPWNLLLVERLMKGGRGAPAIGLALTTALVMTGGHPGTQVHVMVATGLYALIRAVNVPSLPPAERVRRMGMFLGATAVGVLLMAVLLVPVMRAGDGTIGVQARDGFNATIPGSELSIGTIRTVLFPDWWGRPSALSLTPPANYNERTFYAGGVATIFAAIALLSAGAWRRKAPFAVLAVIGVAVPLHAPGLFWLATNLPLLRQVQFQRMMLLFALGVCVLAAFGLQRLLDAPHERRRAIGVLAGGAAVALMALVGAGVESGDVSAAASNIARLRHATGEVTGADVQEGTLIARSAGWWIVVVAGVALLLAALWRWPRRKRALLAALLAFAVLDVMYFAHDYQPMQPAAAVTPPRIGAVDFLLANAANGRFTGIRGGFLTNWLAPLGLRDVRGSDPPQPDLRWYHLWTAYVYPDQPDWAQAIVAQLPEQSGLNAFSVFGVRYIATDPGTEAPAALPSLTIAYDGPDARIFENPDAVPRAMVAGQIVLTRDEAETIQAIGTPYFEPRRQVVVETSEPGARELASSSGAGGSVRVVRESNTTVTLDASLRQPGLVVLNDRLAPGWSVAVDGEPAPAVRANDVMRGVAVGAGRHEIVWSYRVPGLRLGAALSAVGALLLIAASAAVVLPRRRSSGPADGVNAFNGDPHATI